VIENQYGRADHDHLTRGLAYAVARHARGLVVVAEEHRDEFKAVAQYLNDLAELDQERGISVWLVEAKAVRIGESPWAPLFTAVIEPNAFTATVEQAKLAEKPGSLEEFYAQFSVLDARAAAEKVVTAWLDAGYRRRIESNHVVLEAPGPATSGVRTVIAIFNDGRILVPFSSYAGVNSGIEIAALTTSEFRAGADSLFAFNGTEKQARTQPGWLSTDRVEPLVAFCFAVANAYTDALASPAT
jgi:hypothetical protein